MKKIFSNILAVIAAAECVFGVASCQEYSIDSQPEAPLSINIDAMDSYSVLAVFPSRITFNISSNTPWTITSDQQWCRPTPAMSASSSLVSEVAIITEDNNGTTARTATLVIEAEGISETRKITVTQAAKNNLVVVPFDNVVNSDGEKISFNIISNKPWQIIPSTQFLEAIDKTAGEGSEDGAKVAITIDVPANPGAIRTGDITVKTDYDTFTFSITQDGVVIEPEEPLENNCVVFGGEASESVIRMRYNQEWKLQIPEEYASWLSAERDGDNLVIKVTESNRLSERTGKIILKTVKLIPGFDGIELDVKQGIVYNLGNNVEVLENGSVKVSGQNPNAIVSKYPFRKGRYIIEFEEIHMDPMSALRIYMWPYKEVGNANIWIQFTMKEQCRFVAAGGWGWIRDNNFKMGSIEEIEAIKTVEVIIEDDPANAGKERITMKINGEQRAQAANRNSLDSIAGFEGQLIYVGFERGTNADNFTVKSITRYPAE